MSESDLPRAGEERLARPLRDAATPDTAPVERAHATPNEDGSLQAPDERPISAYVQQPVTTDNFAIAASVHMEGVPADGARTEGTEGTEGTEEIGLGWEKGNHHRGTENIEEVGLWLTL